MKNQCYLLCISIFNKIIHSLGLTSNYSLYAGKALLATNSTKNIVQEIELQHLDVGEYFDAQFNTSFIMITQTNICDYLMQITNNYTNLLPLNECTTIVNGWGNEVISNIFIF